MNQEELIQIQNTEIARLKKEHNHPIPKKDRQIADLNRQLAEMKGTNLEPQTKQILQFFFDSGDAISGSTIQKRFGLKVAVVDYHIEALLKLRFITQTRLGATSASCWYAIEGRGRDCIMKSSA
jgi:hypothetical protein